jgi:hypothetical protein
MATNRFNIEKQMPTAPTADVHVMVSDPANANQYKQVPLKSITDPIVAESREAVIAVTTHEIALTAAHIAADSVQFDLGRPKVNSGANKRLVDINGKYNIGATTQVNSALGSATEGVLVTGFSDESSAGDTLTVTVFWKYVDHNPAPAPVAGN